MHTHTVQICSIYISLAWIYISGLCVYACVRLLVLFIVASGWRRRRRRRRGGGGGGRMPTLRVCTSVWWSGSAGAVSESNHVTRKTASSCVPSLAAKFAPTRARLPHLLLPHLAPSPSRRTHIIHTYGHTKEHVYDRH